MLLRRYSVESPSNCIPPSTLILHRLLSSNQNQDVEKVLGILSSISTPEQLKQSLKSIVNILDEMRDRDLSPDVITYTCIICGLGLIGQPDKARNVLKEYGCYPDAAAYNIRNFCIAKRLGDAPGLVEEMASKGLSPNATTYNLFFRVFCWSNDLQSSWNMYQRMMIEGCLPNTQFCMFLMRLFKRHEKVEMAMQLWGDMVEKGFGSYTLVSDVLFDLLCDMGKLEEAEKCFLEMVEKGQKPSHVSFRRIKVLMELANRHEALQSLMQKMAMFGRPLQVDQSTVNPAETSDSLFTKS